MTDARKTLSALTVLSNAIARQELSGATLDSEIRERLGAGWTFAAAVQWLTGTKARAVVDGLADIGTSGGLHKDQMRDLLTLATIACADERAGMDARKLLDLVRRTRLPAGVHDGDTVTVVDVQDQ